MTIRKNGLEGIRATEELKVLLEQTFSLLPKNSNVKDDENTDDLNNANNIIEASLQSMPICKAIKTLEEWKQEKKETDDFIIPIPVVRAMESILIHNSKKENNEGLQKAIRNSGGLVFTSSLSKGSCTSTTGNEAGDAAAGAADDDADNLTKEQRQFRKRMARLRLKHEESKYSKLTNNLGMNPVQDDVTTRSMTYAASIGLNMIIAPLSFGCFMYFFAGSLFDYLYPRQNDLLSHQADIRRVIAGVVSGVLMLFIEMILFVIRTHEMDREALRKQRKNRNAGLKPFGVYTSETSRTFEGK